MNREGFRRILRLAFSRAALFWMLAAWILFYATLAAWKSEAFGMYMAWLRESLLVQVPFVVFLVLALVNLASFALRKLRQSPWTASLWVCMPLGLYLFILGFFVSATISDSGRVFVGLGDTVKPPWQAEALVVGRVDSGLKDEIIDMKTQENSLFTFAPRIFLDGGGIRHEVGAFPPTRAEGTYYHLMDFGLAPGVRIKRAGRILREGYVIQKILPPGVRDSFELPPLPYRFTLRMLPEREIIKGREKAGVYNINRPVYNVVIQKGGDIVFDGTSAGSIEVEGMEVEFYEPDYWYWLEGSRNPGYMILFAGAVLALAGLPLFALVALVEVSHAYKRQRGEDL